MPHLRKFVEAPWPEGEPTRADVASLLEFTIDVEGKVSAVSVVQSAGEAFDRAAISAVSAFEFEPARDGDSPVSVRLRYRYEFAPRVASADTAGTVANESQPESAPTESASSHIEQRESDPRTESKPNRAALPLLPLADESYAAVAEIEAPPREVTKRTVSQEDLMKIPGTSGDALRAIEVMPGVGRTSINAGDPILRGAAPHESRSYIEGVTVPMLYHFGGVKSAFNSRLLSRVDLYPGNFSAAYGRGVSGVVSAKVREPKSDGFHALAEASVIDSTAMVESKIGSNAAIAIAARRSNFGFFYDAFAPKNSFKMLALPSYYDYQGLGSIRLNANHRVRVLAYGSRDAIRLDFANPSDYDPAIRDKVDMAIGYHRAQVSLDSRLGNQVTQHLQLTYGNTQMRQMFGVIRAQLNQHEVMSRGEWNYRISDRTRVNGGFDLEMLSMSGYYVGNRPPQAEGEVMNGGMSTEAVVDASDIANINVYRPGFYTEIEWRPIERLLVVPGVRLDHYSDQGAFTVDPRLSSRYEVTSSFAVKWGVGVYSQNPQYYELLKGLGNPKLRPYHAEQYSAGVEYKPSERISVGSEGFYKRLHDRVVSTPGGTAPYFTNSGVGRIYGAEFFASYLGERFRGWLAYTLSRSERQDRLDAWRLFDNDQTHVLAITGNYALGRGWEVGGRFRFTSGVPYTPVALAVYDANVDVYQPVNAKPFSARNPSFQQLDARVEKTWTFERWRLAWFLDVQNVYNAKNYQGFDYSYNYERRQPIPGLSFVPNVGLRGEL